MASLFWHTSLYSVPGDVVERLLSKFQLMSAPLAYWPDHHPLGRPLQSLVPLKLLLSNNDLLKALSCVVYQSHISFCPCLRSLVANKVSRPTNSLKKTQQKSSQHSIQHEYNQEFLDFFQISSLPFPHFVLSDFRSFFTLCHTDIQLFKIRTSPQKLQDNFGQFCIKYYLQRVSSGGSFFDNPLYIYIYIQLLCDNRWRQYKKQINYSLKESFIALTFSLVALQVLSVYRVYEYTLST